jgi:hypothetical protein
MDKNKTKKPTLIEVAMTERFALEKNGVSKNSEVVSAVEKRIYADVTLTGIDFRSMAQSAVTSEVNSRRPDWMSPGFDWYQRDLLIPIDEEMNGTQVRLELATSEHLDHYYEIYIKEFDNRKAAEKAFKRAFGWIQTNIVGSNNLGEAMTKKFGPDFGK